MTTVYEQTRAWAIDVRYFDANSKAFRITSKRAISIQPGHVVVAFSRNGGGVTFMWHGAITSRTPEKEEEEAEAIEYVLGVSGVHEFDDGPRDLVDFAFSLVKVYRYEEPWRHFNRSYVSIDTFDFETILKGWVFYARTAFGTFANALPTEKLFEYLQLAAEEQPARVVRGGDMASAWRLLREFIQDEYVAPAAIFRESASILRELAVEVEDAALTEQFGVSGENQRTDTIVAQSERFDSFVESLDEDSDVPLLQQFDRAMDEDHHTEDRFEKRFAEIQWPLNVIASS